MGDFLSKRYFRDAISLKKTWLSWVSFLGNAVAFLLFHSILNGNPLELSYPHTIIFILFAIAAITGLIAIFTSKGIGKVMASISLLFAMWGTFFIYTVIAVSGMGQT